MCLVGAAIKKSFTANSHEAPEDEMCGYSKRNLCYTLIIIGILVLAVIIGAIILLVVAHYADVCVAFTLHHPHYTSLQRYYYLWTPPSDLFYGTDTVRLTPTTVRLKLEKAHNRAIFTAYGEWPITYTYSLVDFNQVRSCHRVHNYL